MAIVKRYIWGDLVNGTLMKLERRYLDTTITDTFDSEEEAIAALEAVIKHSGYAGELGKLTLISYVDYN